MHTTLEYEFVCIKLYPYCRSLSQSPLPPSLAGRIYKDLLQLRTNMVRAKQRPPYFSTILLGDGGLAFSGVEGGGSRSGAGEGQIRPPVNRNRDGSAALRPSADARGGGRFAPGSSTRYRTHDRRINAGTSFFA